MTFRHIPTGRIWRTKSPSLISMMEQAPNYERLDEDAPETEAEDKKCNMQITSGTQRPTADS